MLKFKQYIQELFDSKYHTSMVDHGRYGVEYQASTPNGLLVIAFDSINREATEFEVSFQVNKKFEITGLGDQYKILSTVGYAILDFIKIREPFVLYYTAEKTEFNLQTSTEKRSGRVDAYKKLSQLLSKKTGYKLKIKDIGMDSVSFELRRH